MQPDADGSVWCDGDVTVCSLMLMGLCGVMVMSLCGVMVM